MTFLSIFYKHKRGGFNKRLYQLYEAMANEGHSVFFIGSQRIPVEHERIFQNIVHAPFREKENLIFWLFFIVLCLSKAFTVARKRQIDKIITFGPFYTILCCLPITVLKIPAITLVRADNMKHSRNFLRNIFFLVVDWAGIRLSRRVLFVSATLQRVYEKRYRIPPAKTSVAPNNIEKQFRIEAGERVHVRRSVGVSPNTFLISTSGVFNRGKNFDFLINSIGELVSQNVKLIIIGDVVVRNGERKRLEKLTADRGLEECVIFTGWQNDPRPLIACSDLFVIPSKYEGSPNALLEAMGCGVACLGSKIDEIEEILAHQELLFTLKANQELTQKIAKASTNRVFYSRIKTLTEDRCQHFLFDWAKQVLTLSLT